MSGMQYFKRYRMEIPLGDQRLAVAELPDGYSWYEWDPLDLDRHAMTKFRSFRDELDAKVFTCLGEYYGCLRLMTEIARQESFLSGTTWLIGWNGQGEPPQDCGTIQGIAVSDRLGSIQNVGVVPEHRGIGLGRALILKSLEGFHRLRMNRVVLEVTANNVAAVELYQSLGFHVTRTMYRMSPIEETTS